MNMSCVKTETIPWSSISGFTSGYKAAVNRVCWLLEDLFRKGDLNTPEPIALLTRYARKVYIFRANEVSRRNNSNWGHRGACDIWMGAISRLKSLERSIVTYCSSNNVKITARITTIPQERLGIQPPIESKLLPQEKSAGTVDAVPTSKIVKEGEADLVKLSIWRKILSCICCYQPQKKT
jgi:hypothetical protein